MKIKLDKNSLKKFVSTEAGKAVISLCLVLLIGCIFNANGAFFKIATHRDALRACSVYGIMSIGMTIVILTGGIDQTQGSMVGFASVMFAILTIHNQMNPFLSIVLVIIAGGLFGLISGELISRLNMQPFIATIAMMSVIRGLARAITSDTKISTARVVDGKTVVVELPEIFTMIDRKILGGNLTVVTVILAVLIVIFAFIMAKTRWGHDIYAIGGSEEAARLAGINTVRSKVLAYVVSGALCAIAGICLAAQERQGNPASGANYENQAMCMAVIGGVNMMGGRGNITLTCLGILTIGYLQKILSINAIPEAWRLVITGVVLIIAVLTQTKQKRH